LTLAGLQLPVWATRAPGGPDGGIANIPAALIVLFVTIILVGGIKESARATGVVVLIKLAVILFFIAIGSTSIDPANWTPFMPQGFAGVGAAAAIVFFAYIGFDAVSTAAQEARNPKRDMPIGILGSLVICTVLYVLFSYVLSGVATVEDFRSSGREASIAFAISKYMTGYAWLANAVTVAILAGFSSVILVMLLGQSRVFYSMANDGLVPPVFAEIHPKYRTPFKSNMLFFVFTSMFAAFVPVDIVGEMTSIGTLFAFMLVSAGVWIMRVKRPDLERGFRVPALPFVSIMGILVCGAMIFGLGWTNWLRLIGWLAIGFVFYFTYGIKHSRLNRQGANG
jgi:APA family basic amino acid/polyamine antiporter